MNILSILSEEVYMREDNLNNFIMTAPYRYKKYRIPKKKPGEFRLIAQPSKEVKLLQRICLEELKKYLPIHDCAMAYEKNKSIKINAETHKSNSYLLKMDFKDFFPSIRPSDLLLVLESNKIILSEVDKRILSHLLFWKLRKNSPLRLSIGAPSSPFISNAIMYEFDTKVSEICKGFDVTYTRYADDLTFTTNVKGVLIRVPDLIKLVLKELIFPKIRLNNNKTVFSSKKHNRRITGLTISNDGNVSLGRRRKRLISSMVHKYSVNELDKEDVSKLRGLLAFSSDVEPEFIDRLIKKYGFDVIHGIKIGME